MKPWEFHIENENVVITKDVVATSVVKGNFWIRMIKKLVG